MRILLVEDSDDLGFAVSHQLRALGHSVEWAKTGELAIERIAAERFDAVVLDLNLPGVDGDTVMATLRRGKSHVPVLVVTARSEIDDKVGLLDQGADDYLVKPFDLREMEARLRALLRRPAGYAASLAEFGDMSVDFANGTASVRSRPLDLSRREFRLLEILLGRFGVAVPKDRLMSQLFSLDDEVSVNALELHVSRLRRKIEASNLEIGTVRGVGYAIRVRDQG